ncbi:hypothetical protein JXA32_10735 [Candidatus Sumerlaeota bacterium]|nr:hypothetical protein [Candidatus Sumerlaeota bacterium]
MAFRIGKRHKLSIGGISTIVLILLLHLMIYGPHAREYSRAKQDYENARNQLQSLQSRNPGQFNRAEFEKKTEEFEAEFKQYRQQSDIDVRKIWLDDSPEMEAKRRVKVDSLLKDLLLFRDRFEDPRPEPGKYSEMDRNELRNACMRDLREYREDPNWEDKKNERIKIGLSFLNREGWNFPRREDFPANLTEKNSSRLVDVLEKIKGYFTLLDLTDPKRDLVMKERRDQLFALMNVMNFNPNQLYVLHAGRQLHPNLEGFGELVPVLTCLANVDLIEQLANQYQRTSQEYRFERDFFVEGFFKHVNTANLRYPPIKLTPEEEADPNAMHVKAFEGTYQLKALLRLLEMARCNGVADIKSVYLQLPTFIYDRPDVEVAAQAADGAQAAPPQTNKRFGQRPAEGAAPNPPAAAANTATAHVPRPKGAPLATVLPIRIIFTADSIAAWNYLWEISHSDKLYEIDSLSITGDKKGNLTVDVLIGAVPFILSISRIEGITDQGDPIQPEVSDDVMMAGETPQADQAAATGNAGEADAAGATPAAAGAQP